VLAFGGAYYKGRVDGIDIQAGRNAKVQEIIDSTRVAAIEAAAQEIAKIEVKHVTIRQNLQKEIVKEPVYLECKHTPDGLRYLNQALTNSKEPAASGVVPGPSPAN
jgi:hypothetical protein